MSLLPLLTDPAATVRPYAFAEHNWHDYTACERAVRTARYKYIRNAYPDLLGTPPADAVKGPTFQAMRRLRDAKKLAPQQMACFVAPRPAEELYDLEADPQELHNIATQAEMASQLAEMRRAGQMAARNAGSSSERGARRTSSTVKRATRSAIRGWPASRGRSYWREEMP